MVWPPYLRVVGLGRDGTSHGTWVPFVHIPSGPACVQKSWLKKIPMAIRAGVIYELGASGFQVQSSNHIGHAISSI